MTSRRAYARRDVTPGYMPRGRVTSHRETKAKEMPSSCFSIDMPNGFCESGIVGTSKTRSRSRARFGRAHTWRKQPKKVSLTSSKRYSRVLARFLGTWDTCYAAGAMVGTRLGCLWVVLMVLLTYQETASYAMTADRCTSKVRTAAPARVPARDEF